jgi:hypothetical protein
MITKELIENRIHSFWGYGNLNSDIWLIGMEEGFHGSLADLEVRFKQTMDRSVIDLQDDMKDVQDHMQWFRDASSSQPTWRKLIFILLSLDCKNADNEQIKLYQRKEFGRLNSNHCSLEFMPLPCRSISKADWFYSDFGIDYLASRKLYLERIMPTRIIIFRKLINEHSPKVVMMYSLGYKNEWQEIIGCETEKIGDVYYAKQGKTNFFIIPHSTAHGKTNDDWKKITETIKRLTV